MNVPYVNTPEIHRIQQPLVKSQQSFIKSQIERNQQNIDKSLPASANERLERSLRERKRKTGYVTEKIDTQGNAQRHIYLNHATAVYVKLLA